MVRDSSDYKSERTIFYLIVLVNGSDEGKGIHAMSIQILDAV